MWYYQRTLTIALSNFAALLSFLRTESYVPLAAVCLSLVALETLAAQESAIVLPASPNAFGKLLVRDCPKQTPQGAAIIACGRGLGPHSSGKTCVTGVTYMNGEAQDKYTSSLCVIDCTNTALQPSTESCAGTIYKEFEDKIVWRTQGALPSETRAQLVTLYQELIPLVDSGSQAPRREDVKRAIVGLVLNEMTPLRSAAAKRSKGADVVDKYQLPNEFMRPQDSLEGFSPMGIQRDRQLHIYESALLTHSESNKNRYGMADPDELAFELSHELVHFLQQDSGYGESGAPEWSDTHAAEMALSEIHAYHVTLQSAFARALSDAGHPMPAAIHLSLYVTEFKKVWTRLSTAEQQHLAIWAWQMPEGFPRALMIGDPTSDGGVWGILCAANKGPGPCGMENRR